MTSSRPRTPQPRPYHRSHRLIGIDFGTTYSGVAYSWTGRINESSGVVMNWDGIEGRRTNSAKVPSTLYYEDKDKPPKWGFLVPPEKKCIRWFKLLLLEDTDLKPDVHDSKYIKQAREMLRTIGKSEIDVVADYLRAIWQHTLKEMIRNDGAGAVEGQPFRVVITVPAIWPTYASNRLYRAAAAAGITDRRHGGETKLDLYPEPEAAALSIMQDARGQAVDDGEMFVVCDAGGGTVDLVTYELESSYTWTMKECAKGDGQLCGSVFLDQKFDEHLQQWVDVKRWKLVDQDDMRDFKEDQWEGAERGLKRRFNGANRDWKVIMPRSYHPRKSILKWPTKSRNKDKPELRENKLYLKTKHVVDVFDPAVVKIQKLIMNQLDEAKQRKGRYPDAVFLVGGFGQNEYLLDRLEKKFGPLGVTVRRPPGTDGWSAITSGALLRAYNLHKQEGSGNIRVAAVTTRISRISYGMDIVEEFDPNKHSEVDKQFWKSMGREMAINQVDWYLRKNTEIGEEVLKHSWKRHVREPPEENRIKIQLLKCGIDNPPTRKTGDVHVECEIECRITTPFEELPSFEDGDGEVWREIHFELEMRPCGTMLEFAAYYNGKRQPAVRVHPPCGNAADTAQEIHRENTRSPEMEQPERQELAVLTSRHQSPRFSVSSPVLRVSRQSSPLAPQTL